MHQSDPCALHQNRRVLITIHSVAALTEPSCWQRASNLKKGSFPLYREAAPSQQGCQVSRGRACRSVPEA